MPALRRMVAETQVSVDDLVAPLFVREGVDEPQPVPSLPGVLQHTTDSLVKEARRLSSLGVPALVLFGLPAAKDAVGSEAWNPDGVTQVALRELRHELGEAMVLVADLCLDEYTDHGHCGVLSPSGTVDNDATPELYGRFDVPVAAYNVSGEYAMVKAASERGWIDGAAVALEHVGAIKRAGADLILTYFTPELAETLGS